MKEMRIAILPNEQKDDGLVHTRKLLALLGGRAQAFVPEELSQSLGARPLSREVLASLHLAVTLGGDGTMISRARMLLGWQIPLLGVNLGRLGYLAQVEPQAMQEAVEHILSGDYSVERRILLEGHVCGPDGPDDGKAFTAFNEALIHRSTASKLLRIRVDLNGAYFERFLSDGVLVATPTGSTAYNLSAGGPYVQPLAKNLVVTAVCPHSVAARSIVTAQGDSVQLRVEPDEAPEEGHAPLLVVDGAKLCPLAPGESVFMQQSSQYLEIVRLPGQEPPQKKLFQ